MLELMRCTSVSAALHEGESAAGETQPNGDLNCDAQTQMTRFEINLKDKRFVAGFVKTPWSFQKRLRSQNLRPDDLIYIY